MAKGKSSGASTGSTAQGGGKGQGAGRGGGASAGRTSGGRGEPSGAKAGGQRDDDEQATGTPDEHYNLVSVLYHSLKGAQIYSQYVEDAEESGDTELADFFEEVRTEDQRRAERAKELLSRRLGGSDLGEDEEA